MEDWLRVELPLLIAGESSAGIYRHMYMTKMPYPFPHLLMLATHIPLSD